MGENKLEESFWQPVKLLQDIKFAADDIDVYQQECRKLYACLDTLASCLQTAFHILRNGSDRFCQRPTHRILDDTTHTLELCSTLIGKCRRGSLLRWLFTITTATEFKKAESLLENAIANIKWLLSSVTDEEEGNVLGMPPIASALPNLALVWSALSKLQGGKEELREAAATDIALFASTSEQNGQLIISEGGISLLLKALNDGTLHCKVMAATVLRSLAINKNLVHEMVQQDTIPTCVNVLQQGPRQVQIIVVQVLADMVSQDEEIKTVVANANGVMPLVALLLETIDDEIRVPKIMPFELPGNHSKSYVQEIGNLEHAGNSGCDNEKLRTYNKVEEPPNNSNTCKILCDVFAASDDHKEETDKVTELKTELKTNLQVQVTRALRLLAADHLENSTTITETRAMLALAKLVVGAQGEVQKNAVMTIMELAAVAETHPGFRKLAFKLSSPAAKVVLMHLHQIILDESAAPQLQSWCIKAVGSLARAFSSNGNNLIKALVLKLSNTDSQNLPVIVEAINALLKFTDEDNFLCEQHCLAVVDVPALPSLVQLVALDSVKRVQFPAIHLMSQLVLHVGQAREEAFLEAAVLSVLKSVASSSSTFKQYKEFASKDDISQAIFHLECSDIVKTNMPSSHDSQIE